MSIDNLGDGNAYAKVIRGTVVDYNIPVVKAACNYEKLAEPANSPNAITVGATAKQDEMWKYSNYGAGVDILAPRPGEDIMSAITTSDSSTGKESGTSMTAPLVSGAIAVLLEGDIKLSAKNDVTDANTVIYKLIDLSTKDIKYHCQLKQLTLLIGSSMVCKICHACL